MDMTSRLADRRCPECDAVQPLFVSREGSRRAWQRGAEDVIACPECALPLRLEADTRDPQGIAAAVVMVVAMGGALFAAIWAATRFGFGEWVLGGILLVVVVLGTGLSMVWNGRAARRRRVVIAREEAGE